jgi:hypothetical protein
MSDERLDQLLAHLARDLGDEVAAAALAPGAFAERAARWAALPARSYGPLRLAVALVLLMLALLAAYTLIGSLTPNPNDLVRLSQAAHEKPPPFTLTISRPINVSCGTGEGEAALRYLHDGRGSLRRECLTGGATYDYWVANARIEGWWSGTAWHVQPTLARPGVPIATVDWLNWVKVGELIPGVTRQEGSLVTCPDWHLDGAEQVAGRPARIVSCGFDRYWIDEGSHLLVKVEVGGTIVEAEELQIGAVPPAGLFEIENKPDVRRALTVGQVPPPWVLPLVSGGSLDLVSFRGRPAAVLFIQDSCTGPCLRFADFDAVVGARAERLSSAAIVRSQRYPWLAETYTAETPVVIDEGLETAGWELDLGGGPIVLFDADGRVAGFTDPRSAAAFAEILDAFLSGAPIAFPPVGDGVFVDGEPAPALTASLLGGGGMLDLATLRGRPVVVLSPRLDSFTDLGPTTETDALITEFARAAAAVGRDATFVVIVWERWEKGWKRAPWPDRDEVLGRARARVGAAVDDILVIEGHGASSYGSRGSGWGEHGWSSLLSVGGEPDLPRAAVVVVDGHGLVADVLWGDSLPAGAELASMVRSVLAERP